MPWIDPQLPPIEESNEPIWLCCHLDDGSAALFLGSYSGGKFHGGTTELPGNVGLGDLPGKVVCWHPYNDGEMPKSPLLRLQMPGSLVVLRCQPGACPVCRKYEGQQFEVATEMVLPPDGCSCEGGCRAYYEVLSKPVMWWSNIPGKAHTE